MRQVQPHTPGQGYVCRACEKPHIPGCVHDRDPSADCVNIQNNDDFCGDDTNSGRCIHGVGFDEACEQCEEGPEL